MGSNDPRGPLAGIRVIDAAAIISGPLATMLLGDQGADVVKIEAPGLGDPTRLLGAVSGGMTSTFVNCNRSKRSVVLDLRNDQGKEVLRRLVRGADVFVQNFRPGVIERMGFGYEDLKEIAPDIIYVSISGFGETGPLAKRKVYDNIIQAMSGMAAVQTDPDTGRPELVRNLEIDKATAYTVAQAVTAALFARERGQGGQHLHVAMLDVAFAFLWPDGMMNHTFIGDEVMTIPPFGTIYRLYETADGYMTIAALNDKEWADACRAFDREDLIEDPRFATGLDRFQHMTDLREALSSVLTTRTSEEWCEIFEKHDVAHAPVLGLDDVHEHPQTRANNVLVESEHPVAGLMREPRPAPKFDGTPSAPCGHAPAHGEHTENVLGELGYSAEEMASLRAANVIP